jgi:Fe-Mn family superoxide dismutase
MIRKIEGKAETRKAREYSSLRGLDGLPDALVEAHLRLYEGYVTNFSALQRSLREDKAGTPEWAELQRRVGFELNGIRLHELYFDALVPRGNASSRELQRQFAVGWESFEEWETEFRAVGQMRGVGWAILYQDPETLRLSNHWIGLHEVGHPAGYVPILVMDVWEHAFTGMERARYIDAFFANVDWEQVESRLER